MSKKILYIGNFIFPDGNAAALRCRSNASVLRKLGYEVEFLGVDKIRSIIGIIKTSMSFDNSTIFLRKFPKSISDKVNFLVSANDIIKWVESHDNDIHCIICYNFPSIAFLNLHRYCKKHRLLLINECTEWYSSKGYGFLGGIIKYFDTTLRIKVVPKYASYNIVTTHFLGKYCSDKYIIIPETYSRVIERNANSDSENLRLIYIGNPGFGNNKDNLGKMIELLSNVNSNSFLFDIVGITEEEFRFHFNKFCSFLDKIKDIVIFHGRQPHEECTRLLMSSDYTFLYRNISRISSAGFPHKLAESVEFNIPFITTRTSDIEQYFTDGETCWFLDFDDKLAINKLESIIDKGKEKSLKMSASLLEKRPLYVGNFSESFMKMMDL